MMSSSTLERVREVHAGLMLVLARALFGATPA